MSTPGRLFVGRLSRSTREDDLRETFEAYGTIMRCDIKTGPESNYGFLDFEDRLDAEDAVLGENGRNLHGRRITVEWAKGAPPSWRVDECASCGRTNHATRDCPHGRGDKQRRSRSPRRPSRYDRDRSRSRSRDRRPPPPRRPSSRDRDRSRDRSSRRRRSKSSDRSDDE